MAYKFVTEVTEVNFEAEVLKSDKLVLIDFYADWCGPCRGMSPILDKFAEENQATVKVVKINFDNNRKLAEDFGVTALPTLVTMKDGAGIFGSAGAMSKSQMEKFCADSLQSLNPPNINTKGPDFHP